MDSIFFVLSKLAHILIEPLNWLIILIALALLFLLLRKNHLVRRVLGIALCLGFFIGYMPTSQFAMRILEDAVPQTPLTPEQLNQIGGILILGGAIEGGPITRDRSEVSIGSAAERVTKALQLLRQHPKLPFIFSGYSGRLLPQGPSEADAFKQLLQEQGLGSHPGYYENQSRNTYENMLYSKKIITNNTHGTGCTLSSAIAAFMAKGEKMETAVKKAKIYLNNSLQAGAGYRLGNGNGPLHHFYRLWK
jgi:uncharacterized SAM-binding protein YcdF (DUF218 family)